MNAAQARKKATEIDNRDTDDRYVAIKAIIQIAVEKGEFSCYVYDVPIKKVVQKKLEAEGYKVGPSENDRNETLTKISW
jgi:diphthamide synthase (EF-2-diphthine--ammonia ligase)